MMTARLAWGLAALGCSLLSPAWIASAQMPAERPLAPVVQPASAADGMWTGILPSPQARAQHVAVYDPDLQRMIMLGGRCLDGCCSDGPVPADTWTYPLDSPTASWIEIRPGGALPPAGLGPVAIYDPVRNRTVVVALPTLWVLGPLNSPGWSTLSATGTPPSSTIVAAVYDPVRDRMLAMAGNGGVWALSLGGTPEWTELAPTGIVPSSLKSALYDPARDRVVVFADSVRALSLVGSPSWSVVANNRATLGHSVIFDPVRDRAIVHGGSLGGDVGTPDTWELTFSGTPQWTQIGSNGPTAAYHSAVYDPSNDRMIVFGGYAFQFYFDWTVGELWALSLDGTPQWTDLTPASPPRACANPAVRDPVRDQMILVDDAVRALDLAGPPEWSVIAATGPAPAEREDYSAIYDPLRDRLLMSGGSSTGGVNLQDLWSLSLGGSPQWTQPGASGAPPDTAKPAVYDPVRDRMLIVGGDRVWALSLAAPMSWSELTPSGTPPAGIYGSSVTYDPVRDRVLVFGGVGTSGLTNALWALDLASGPAWSLLSPASTAPDARSRPMAIYDSARDRIVMSGGDTGAAAPASDTWELKLSPTLEWGQLSPDVVEQGGWTAIYDPDRDRMVTVGICATSSNPFCLDPEPRAWALWFNALVDVAESPMSRGLWLAQSHPNPARGDLVIRFSVALSGKATLRVYDISGRLVQTLLEGEVQAGDHTVGWNGTRSDGARANTGAYFYELRMSGERVTRRMILLR